MEYWDLYTKYRERTERTHMRGEELSEGLYHLVVHVWIRNPKGEYLISQRAASRPTFPLMWECVGGSVLQGEELPGERILGDIAFQEQFFYGKLYCKKGKGD